MAWTFRQIEIDSNSNLHLKCEFLTITIIIIMACCIFPMTFLFKYLHCQNINWNEIWIRKNSQLYRCVQFAYQMNLRLIFATFSFWMVCYCRLFHSSVPFPRRGQCESQILLSNSEPFFCNCIWFCYFSLSCFSLFFFLSRRISIAFSCSYVSKTMMMRPNKKTRRVHWKFHLHCEYTLQKYTQFRLYD